MAVATALAALAANSASALLNAMWMRLDCDAFSTLTEVRASKSRRSAMVGSVMSSEAMALVSTGPLVAAAWYALTSMTVAVTSDTPKAPCRLLLGRLASSVAEDSYSGVILTLRKYVSAAAPM